MTAGFPAAARTALADAQLRRNLGKATTAIRVKRANAVAELDDWEALRDAGAAIKARAMATLPELLERLEASVTRAGGVVHWARDGAEANAIIAGIARDHGADEVIKVKSLATDEIGLNEALELRGIEAIETDLAELIVQLGDDEQSHILVPAIHRNRAEIAALFERTIAQGQELGLEPRAIAEAARRHLREKFLSVPVAISGANFGIAETGSIGVVESEGNGRMCTTLPDVLVTLMGIEKVLPEWRDLEVMLQLLPRSSTAERMNPYTSIWTGVREDDGPREFHLVLLDAGRTQVLEDEVGRQALHCIRCSACLNSCPVYSRTGGHAYESVYPGPIGAILTPQLEGLDRAPTLPWASSLCGACYEVCPVKIDIPTVLVHLRGRVVREVKSRWGPERLAMDALSRVFRSRGALRARAADGARGQRADREAAEPAERLDDDARAARAVVPEQLVPRLVAPSAERARRDPRADRRRARRRARPCPRSRATTTWPAAARRPARRPSSRASASAPPSTARRSGASPRGGLEDAVVAACAEQGARRLAVPPGAPHHLPGLELLVDDPPISARGLDQVDGVLTGCALAIAETGTVVLDGGDDERPPRAHARARLPHLPRRGGRRPRVGPRRDRRARARRRRGPAADARLRPERHVGHRAGARRGRPRPAHAGDPGARVIARLLAGGARGCCCSARPRPRPESPTPPRRPTTSR